MTSDIESDPAVLTRIAEFLGGDTLAEATCEFITADDCSPDVRFDPRPVSELEGCLQQQLDIGRSMWDRRSLIADLDIEYVNFDNPAEAYLEPDRVFRLQRPIVRAILETLEEQGIQPLHLLSGRGHHFLWQIRRNSSAFRQLADHGHVPAPLRNCNAQPHPPHGRAIDPQLAAAYAGLGQLAEFIAHRVLDRAAGQCEIPIALTAVEAGPGDRGREVLSIDISEYGDPLHTRGIRVPFNVYLKAQQQRHLVGLEVAESLPPLFVIPIDGLSEHDGLRLMRDPLAVRELARRTSVRIPDQSVGMENLIAAYARSSLARFHEWFYAAEHDSPETWPNTYDRAPLDSLPPCVRIVLEEPNDRLLKPAGIQHVVRVLCAQGWHPRHIAGVIRSKYERDFGWGDMFYRHNACSRADFYARLFSGLLATGHDQLLDFNCHATQEKHFCPTSECNCNLEGFRASLTERRAEWNFAGCGLVPAEVQPVCHVD